MTAAADLVLTNAEVHTLTESGDETHEAVAVRDGRVVRVGAAYDVEFLVGTETRVVDLDGRVVLPGFVDAHTHLGMVGRRLVHADLSDAGSRADCLDRLREQLGEVERDDGNDDTGADHGDWIQGFGYDESGWPSAEYLTREGLDSVSESRPVVAFREDMHVASLNSVALERLGLDASTPDVAADDGRATGVLVESAVDAVWEAVEPDPAEMRQLLGTAQTYANERGVTGVHDMVRRSHAPRVYREMERDGDLSLRVRLNYWADHLDALVELGLRTGHGSELVRVGAIKTYTDGSFGGRTARLKKPYADADTRGQWVVSPDELDEIVERASGAGFQVAAHAIGDAAVEAVLDAYEAVGGDDGDARHRIEHAELADDDAIDRMADLGVVASVQPNFLKWAGEGGLYEARLGERRRETNRYRAMFDAGVAVAFGSDCMPLDPLLGVHHAVTAPEPAQRLTVTEALGAYTTGGAHAAFEASGAGRVGVVEPGAAADLVALSASPWEHPAGIDTIDPVLTVVDGEVVYASESVEPSSGPRPESV